MNSKALQKREQTKPELGTLANQAHQRAQASAREALDHAREAGEHLLQAKSLCEHGEWGVWLAEHFGSSERTAQAYMRVAEHWDAIKSNPQTSADLSIDRALKLLAEPKPSEESANEHQARALRKKCDRASDLHTIEIEIVQQSQQEEESRDIPIECCETDDETPESPGLTRFQDLGPLLIPGSIWAAIENKAEEIDGVNADNLAGAFLLWFLENEPTEIYQAIDRYDEWYTSDREIKDSGGSVLVKGRVYRYETEDG